MARIPAPNPMATIQVTTNCPPDVNAMGLAPLDAVDVPLAAAPERDAEREAAEATDDAAEMSEVTRLEASEVSEATLPETEEATEDAASVRLLISVSNSR